jgi:multicomponent Na+:H+ antiporter subunit D
MQLALFTPLAGAVAIAVCGRRPNLRETATLVTAVLLFGLVAALVLREELTREPVVLVETLPGLSLALAAEPLGLLFALVASGLWILTSVYSIGYMRGNNESNQTRFYVCFAVSIAATMGVAFAANMFTLFVFYEALTLATYPLVTHKGNEEARQGGRTYLGLLLSTSIGFLLVALIWTWSAAGTLDFTAGGILRGKIDDSLLPWLLALYFFGIGKAALMPFHRWLPAAMVAPTPVSALLHAVAVVKAGVFTILKVTIYIFGIDLLRETDATSAMMWIAAFSLLAASLIALRKNNLKARLAYSTVSQLAYVTLGATLATAMGVMGGALQIAMHAMGKITLFFCAGAIYVATHKTEINDMDGLGRTMPFTYAAFFIAALSIIGLPPLGGSWSKWYLMLGAADAGQQVMIAVLMVSSLLNIAYLIPIPVRGFFFAGSGEPASPGVREAPLACVVPLCLTAAGSVLLFFYADPIYQLLLPITGQ